jgi:Asp-tRNA(Asn)/Glu-tRNA(Gln) amidotransferase A subunit family amidase
LQPYALTSIKGVPLGLDPRLPLKGITIGVLRENMVVKDDAQVQPVQIVENAISALQALGAEIVDPGIGGSIFTDNIAQQFPYLEPQTLEASFPALFSGGNPIDQLVALFYDTSQFPTGAGAPTITNLGPESTTGERKYVQNRWLAGRGDANIHNIEDLINHSNFWSDVNPNVGTPAVNGLISAQTATNMTNENHVQRFFTLQQIVRSTFADQGVDLIVSPTSVNPQKILTNPSEPSTGGSTTVLGAHGFPELSVPVGFTTEVFDRVPQSISDTTGVLTGPIPAVLPVGMELQGLPFSEQLLLYVASTYQAAYPKSRQPPPEFPPLPGEP